MGPNRMLTVCQIWDINWLTANVVLQVEECYKSTRLILDTKSLAERKPLDYGSGHIDILSEWLGIKGFPFLCFFTNNITILVVY